MLSGEEALSLAYKIINSNAGKSPKPSELKEILREALDEFDQTLKTLTPNQREAALSLFLQQIRETAFDFRLAILYVALKDEFLIEGRDLDSDAYLKRCREDAVKLARLFRLL